jgi:hypothetical protein
MHRKYAQQQPVFYKALRKSCMILALPGKRPQGGREPCACPMPDMQPFCQVPSQEVFTQQLYAPLFL